MTDILSRRRFVKRSAASALALGIALDSASNVALGGTQQDLFVGRFLEATGPRSAVVRLLGQDVVSVAIEANAFVSHGADGVVDTPRSFVPGEEVVVRGVRTGRGIVASEMQSLYADEDGVGFRSGSAFVLRTGSGSRVNVPAELGAKRLPSGFVDGSRYSATVWTNPSTGVTTAVTLDEAFA